MSNDLQTKVEANVGEDAIASVVPEKLPPVSEVFMNMVSKKIKTVTSSIKKLGKEFGHDVDIKVQIKIKQ